jgi:glycosyltransferase involved in cell wall biosynthesis
VGAAMKVIFLGTLPPIIGLSPYCLHLSYALSKKIDLLFLNFKRFSHRSQRFQRSSKIDDTLYQSYLKKIKVVNWLDWYNPLSGFFAGMKLKGDVLHVQWWISSLFFVIFPVVVFAKMKQMQIVLSVHNVLPHERGRYGLLYDKVVNKALFPFADVLIVHNQRNKQVLSKEYVVDSDDIEVITHGVLDMVKTTSLTRKKARELLHLPPDKQIVLFFGYIRPYKGVDVLLRAFAQVKSDLPEALLYIVGQPLGTTWKSYQRIIDEYQLENRIRVELGFAPEENIPPIFSAADIVVLPYKYLDTHGGIGALALPFGQPLIVTNVGGLPEYVKNSKAVVCPDNVKDLAEALKRVLTDKTLLLELAKDSEELAKTLSWNTIADHTINVYQKQ